MKKAVFYAAVWLLCLSVISGCAESNAQSLPGSALTPILAPSVGVPPEAEEERPVPEAGNRTLMFTGVEGIHLGYEFESLPIELQNSLTHVEEDAVVTVLSREDCYIRNIYQNDDIYIETIRENPASPTYHGDAVADSNRIRKIVLCSDAYTTLGGIALGDPAQKVRDVYGDYFTDTSPDATFMMGLSDCMIIQIEDDEVVSIVFDGYNSGSIL